MLLFHPFHNIVFIGCQKTNFIKFRQVYREHVHTSTFRCAVAITVFICLNAKSFTRHILRPRLISKNLRDGTFLRLLPSSESYLSGLQSRLSFTHTPSIFSREWREIKMESLACTTWTLGMISSTVTVLRKIGPNGYSLGISYQVDIKYTRVWSHLAQRSPWYPHRPQLV